MKKMKTLLTTTLLTMSTNIYAQYGVTEPMDETTNPSGQAFGGAMGGGPTTVPSSSTAPPTPTVQQTDAIIGPPRGSEFPEQQEEATNFAGGALGGNSTPSSRIPSSDLPATAPAVPPTQPDIPATGTGTTP